MADAAQSIAHGCAENVSRADMALPLAAIKARDDAAGQAERNQTEGRVGGP